MFLTIQISLAKNNPVAFKGYLIGSNDLGPQLHLQNSFIAACRLVFDQITGRRWYKPGDRGILGPISEICLQQHLRQSSWKCTSEHEPCMGPYLGHFWVHLHAWGFFLHDPCTYNAWSIGMVLELVIKSSHCIYIFILCMAYGNANINSLRDQRMNFSVSEGEDLLLLEKGKSRKILVSMVLLLM